MATILDKTALPASPDLTKVFWGVENTSTNLPHKVAGDVLKTLMTPTLFTNERTFQTLSSGGTYDVTAGYIGAVPATGSGFTVPAPTNAAVGSVGQIWIEVDAGQSLTFNSAYKWFRNSTGGDDTPPTTRAYFILVSWQLISGTRILANWAGNNLT